MACPITSSGRGYGDVLCLIFCYLFRHAIVCVWRDIHRLLSRELGIVGELWQLHSWWLLWLDWFQRPCDDDRTVVRTHSAYAQSGFGVRPIRGCLEELAKLVAQTHVTLSPFQGGNPIVLANVENIRFWRHGFQQEHRSAGLLLLACVGLRDAILPRNGALFYFTLGRDGRFAVLLTVRYVLFRVFRTRPSKRGSFFLESEGFLFS